MLPSLSSPSDQPPFGVVDHAGWWVQPEDAGSVRGRDLAVKEREDLLIITVPMVKAMKTDYAGEEAIPEEAVSRPSAGESGIIPGTFGDESHVQPVSMDAFLTRIP